MPLIEAKGLTKKFRQDVKEPGLVGSLQHFFTRHYRDKMAVDHIDLNIEVGESVAYLGPNGAGKSTTIKMLTAWFPTNTASRTPGTLVSSSARGRSCGGTSPSSSRSISRATCTRSRSNATRRTWASSLSCSEWPIS
jgi:energy-coupling factor transporter ATP-binding protein EcfA2